ncbi:hypothetical protein EYF80_048854 [Liparis tanakae]|uniref:Uncharacterized protein n=1 Tax=Liparis tanakae TaxID=230148 RepID=A0A4Z2FJ87_9TELE|nr:hypothetical protein EYF80_048854 [Liparis tanakae]
MWRYLDFVPVLQIGRQQTQLPVGGRDVKLKDQKCFCPTLKDQQLHLVDVSRYASLVCGGLLILYIFPLQAAVVVAVVAVVDGGSPPLPPSLSLSPSPSPWAPPLEASPWERCTFPGKHGYVQIEGRDGTRVGSHQRNNMCARHGAGRGPAERTAEGPGTIAAFPFQLQKA